MKTLLIISILFSQTVLAGDARDEDDIARTRICDRVVNETFGRKTGTQLLGEFTKSHTYNKEGRWIQSDSLASLYTKFVSKHYTGKCADLDNMKDALARNHTPMSDVYRNQSLDFNPECNAYIILGCLNSLAQSRVNMIEHGGYNKVLSPFTEATVPVAHKYPSSTATTVRTDKYCVDFPNQQYCMERARTAAPKPAAPAGGRP